MGLLLRGTVLFMIGNFFAVFMNLLQINRQGNVSLKMPPELLENLFLKEWWVPPMCGAAAGKNKIKIFFIIIFLFFINPLIPWKCLVSCSQISFTLFIEDLIYSSFCSWSWKYLKLYRSTYPLRDIEIW